MLRITHVEQTPFHTLAHRTSGPKGIPLRNHLPFHRAYATELPSGMDAVVFASDLQDREDGDPNRLMGVPASETLENLAQPDFIPQPKGAFLCGDLYDDPDCYKRGGTGAVIDGVVVVLRGD